MNESDLHIFLTVYLWDNVTHISPFLGETFVLLQATCRGVLTATA